MRSILAINNDWYYKSQYEQDMETSLELGGFERVNLPHANVELPYNYFDEKAFQIVSCYKYPLSLPKDCRGKVVYMHFEGVMTHASVYLNGSYAGEHKGGYTPFDIRLDELYNWELETNLITVVVDSTERSDIPPFGGQIDYLTYGGIYREVSIGIYDKVFIRNVKIETKNILKKSKALAIKLFVENLGNLQGKANVEVLLSERNGIEVHRNSFLVDLDEGVDECQIMLEDLQGIKLWDIDEPNLYELKLSLSIADVKDEYSCVFGFREACFTPEGFYLNNKKIKLRGLNRHQAYPYVGYAMPKRVQEKDADILKNELHLNLVRTSHYPQSKHFLNRCDELGLLVFEEIPGWQHIGNTEWKEVAKQNVKEMIERDWNHPSIILWGVRINESPDDDEFYEETNKVARELDSTRQTGGVRCIPNSRLFEDVYTFNDFVHDGVQPPLRSQREVTGLDRDVPYMVTECNGHMYPTKRFDQEERQMEHSLRHLRVLDAAYKNENISGLIGWCAFDYNTHKDFGSGDRICYHGVMDMFRISKFAAYAYSSQVAPEVEAVLEPVTYWARGERSIGGIIPLVVFTNCDYIEFQYGENEPKRIYPSSECYEGIPYPPAIIDFSVIKPEEAGSWGMIWKDAVIRGYFRDKLIVVKTLSEAPIPSDMLVEADDSLLSSAQKDATRVVVKLVDQYKNLLPFIDEIVKVSISGPVKLQGPSELVVKGGAIGFWVETLNIQGEAEITVESRILGQKSIRLSIE